MVGQILVVAHRGNYSGQKQKWQQRRKGDAGNVKDLRWRHWKIGRAITAMTLQIWEVNYDVLPFAALRFVKRCLPSPSGCQWIPVFLTESEWFKKTESDWNWLKVLECHWKCLKKWLEVTQIDWMSMRTQGKATDIYLKLRQTSFWEFLRWWGKTTPKRFGLQQFGALRTWPLWFLVPGAPPQNHLQKEYSHLFP